MVMPMIWTSPNEILGAFSGMLDGSVTENGNGDMQLSEWQWI